MLYAASLNASVRLPKLSNPRPRLITMPEQIVITPPAFDPVVAYGIGSITVVMAVLCVVVYSSGNRRRALMLALGFLLLMGGSALLAVMGILTRFDYFPPPMMIMFAALLVIAFAVGLSPFGRTLATKTSLVALIGLQTFRFPLELVMHHAVNRSLMPTQLSYSGYNFDIVTGLGAIVLTILLALKVRIPSQVIWGWNIWGMYCLLAIMIIAIGTSPVIRAFGDDRADLNTWVLYFPYVWLPVVLVTMAICGHIIITRKLLQRAT
jgi:hypothetical protein